MGGKMGMIGRGEKRGKEEEEEDKKRWKSIV